MRIAIDDVDAPVAQDVHAFLLRTAARELAAARHIENVRVRIRREREGFACVVAVGLAGGALVAERERATSLVLAAEGAIRKAALTVSCAPGARALLRARA